MCPSINICKMFRLKSLKAISNLLQLSMKNKNKRFTQLGNSRNRNILLLYSGKGLF